MIERIVSTPQPISLAETLYQKELFSQISSEAPLVIIMDSNVQRHIFPTLQHFLQSLNFSIRPLFFQAGEHSKQWRTFFAMQQQLSKYGITTKSTILAVGGGVTLDLAGFLASTYHRGLSCVFVPTTLIAMIDASIGGKNGINVNHIKNQLGTFYLPTDVWIIPQLLQTLPQQEWYNGSAEAIKHGFTIDSEIWSLLHTHGTTLYSNPSLLRDFLKKNCIAKAKIVAQDIHNQKLRHILNFGHTIGHAIEAASKGMLSHGAAVSIGMVIETKIFQNSGQLHKSQNITSLKKILKTFHLPTSLQEIFHYSQYNKLLQPNMFTPKKLLQFASKDKKNKKYNELTLVPALPDSLISTNLDLFSPDPQLVLQILKEEYRALCHN